MLESHLIPYAFKLDNMLSISWDSFILNGPGGKKERNNTYGPHSYNPLKFLLLAASNELLSGKILLMSLPSFLNIKTEIQRQHSSMPHSLVVNIRLHLNGDLDSVARPTVNANRNMRVCVEWKALAKSPGPNNRRPNWSQAQAGHILVARQPLSEPCSALPVCANGSCHLHSFCASPRWVMFTHSGPGVTVKSNP